MSPAAELPRNRTPPEPPDRDVTPLRSPCSKYQEEISGYTGRQAGGHKPRKPPPLKQTQSILALNQNVIDFLSCCCEFTPIFGDFGHIQLTPWLIFTADPQTCAPWLLVTLVSFFWWTWKRRKLIISVVNAPFNSSFKRVRTQFWRLAGQ